MRVIANVSSGVLKMAKFLNSKAHFYLKLTLFFVFVYFGCEKDYSSLIIAEKIVEGPTRKPIFVEPDSGYVGTKLKIFGMKFSSRGVRTNSIEFEGWEAIRPDSGSTDTLFTYIPFGAETGSIKISYWDGFVFHDTIGISNQLNVVQECDTLSICVLPYNVDVSITEEMSRRVDLSHDKMVDWNAEINNDTVTISRSYEHIDWGITKTLKFLHTDNQQLPRLLSYISIRVGDTGTRIDTLKTGIIKIQDWDTSGIVSGRVFGEYWEPLNDIFWFNFDD